MLNLSNHFLDPSLAGPLLEELQRKIQTIRDIKSQSPTIERWYEIVVKLASFLKERPQVVDTFTSTGVDFVRTLQRLQEQIDPYDEDEYPLVDRSFDQLEILMNLAQIEILAQRTAGELQTQFESKIDGRIGRVIDSYAEKLGESLSESNRLLAEHKQIAKNTSEMFRQLGERTTAQVYEVDQGDEKEARILWQWLMATGFTLWLVAIGLLAWASLETPLSTAHLVRQASISIPFVLWIFYCMRTSARHHAAERENFRLAFQMNSLAPLTSGLSQETHEAVRLAAIPHIYAQPGSAVTVSDSSPAMLGVIENAMRRVLSKESA